MAGYRKLVFKRGRSRVRTLRAKDVTNGAAENMECNVPARTPDWSLAGIAFENTGVGVLVHRFSLAGQCVLKEFAAPVCF